MKKKPSIVRDPNLPRVYAKVLNYTCAHADCKSGMDIEVHHIRPLYKGGDDKLWNMISLCKMCHETRHLHSESESHLIELYTYKSMHELRLLGFCVDEEDKNFDKNWKRWGRENA